MKCACGRGWPSFGLEGGRATHCRTCKDADMMDVKNPKCACGRGQPSFGLEGGRATHCSRCKTEDMRDVVHPKCACGRRRPSFGLEGGRATHCRTCKDADMLDVNNPKCACGRGQPSFGLEGGRATHCSRCKTEVMRDVVHPKCACGRRQPSFGLEGGKATHCRTCKDADMRDVVNPKCACGRGQPTFGLEGGRATHCSKCKSDDMLDIHSSKCVNGCGTRVVHERYKGHCLRCFVHLFPGEKVSRNYKVKEQHFTDYIKAACVFPEHAGITLDKRLQGGCSGKRPDIFVDVYTHTVHCENDEDQHRNALCESKRTMEPGCRRSPPGPAAVQPGRLYFCGRDQAPGLLQVQQVRSAGDTGPGHVGGAHGRVHRAPALPSHQRAGSRSHGGAYVLRRLRVD